MLAHCCVCLEISACAADREEERERVHGSSRQEEERLASPKFRFNIPMLCLEKGVRLWLFDLTSAG